MESFDAWNNLKKKIDSNENDYRKFPKKGEVWISSIGKNIGFEQNGVGTDFLRPVLIVSRFNNQIFWCVPLSTKQKSLDFYFNFTDPHNKNVSAILAQMRLMSVKRLIRKLYEIDAEKLEKIGARLRAFL